jgi:hypothetical protein
VSKPEVIFTPTENIYRNIQFMPATQTRGERYCVITNSGYQSYDTMIEALDARDRIEQAGIANKAARWRKPQEQAVLNTSYETRQYAS